MPDGGSSETKNLSRRDALARLGLATTAAYVTPTLIQLDRSANATVRPSPCRGPGRRRGRGRGHDRDRDDGRGLVLPLKSGPT
jgi:hypothetical protein